MSGRVTLVGGGPGRPDLLTVAAVSAPAPSTTVGVAVPSRSP